MACIDLIYLHQWRAVNSVVMHSPDPSNISHVSSISCVHLMLLVKSSRFLWYRPTCCNSRFLYVWATIWTSRGKMPFTNMNLEVGLHWHSKIEYPDICFRKFGHITQSSKSTFILLKRKSALNQTQMMSTKYPPKIWNYDETNLVSDLG